MRVELRLLGEVTTHFDGRVVDLGPARQRCVLAALAVDAGRVVPTDQLMRRVWGAETPRRGRATLHSHISRLRRALTDAGDMGIVRRSGGYVLTVNHAEAIDLHRFRTLCTRARDADDLRKTDLLAEALGLWHGEPLTGLSGEWVEHERERLRHEHLTAMHDLVDARLRLGEGEDLIAELSARTGRYPLDERVAGQYMLALYQGHRTAEALEHYRSVRVRLADELGVDPGEALQRLHQQILTADPALPGSSDRVATGTLPRQLPPAPVNFIGRRDALARLDSALSADGVAIAVISGTGGIGKTWLALHWAHRHRDRFPDGQLFVDLHGFAPNNVPMEPMTAVRGFLHALDVGAQSIPAEPHAQVALYRSLIAGKRMLVVADNARDAAQVVPLLPGSGASMVLVTSRNRLAELITRQEAHLLPVDVLSPAEARQALQARLGAQRLAAEPAAAAELLDQCGGFPLALGLVAGRAVTHPELPLAMLATEFSDAAGPLEALDDDSLGASLPAVLSWSYRTLTAEQARVFALLGLAPGSDLGLPAAANLTALPVRTTKAALRALEDLHLIQQHTSARWRMHDLVKLFAVDRAHHDLTRIERATARRRLIDFYLHTAYAGELLLHPHRPPIQLADPVPGCHPEQFADAATAMDWFTAEEPTLLAVQRLAEHEELHSVVWQLAWSLDTAHLRLGLLPQKLAAWRTGVAAADRDGHPAARALAHRSFGQTAITVGRLDEASTHLHQAMTLHVQTGDRMAKPIRTASSRGRQASRGSFPWHWSTSAARSNCSACSGRPHGKPVCSTQWAVSRHGWDGTTLPAPIARQHWNCPAISATAPSKPSPPSLWARSHISPAAMSKL